MDSAELISLGGHPALAFVNSSAGPAGKPMELLGDGAGYLDWLTRTDLITELPDFPAAAVDAVAAEAWDLREWLRPVIATWVSTGEVAAGAVDRINVILALDERHYAFEGGALVDRRRWREPRQLLVPPVAAAARLFAGGPRDLVRKCEAEVCTLWFLDQTRSHKRRWCSMAVCGNREKARSHRERVSATQLH